MSVRSFVVPLAFMLACGAEHVQVSLGVHTLGLSAQDAASFVLTLYQPVTTQGVAVDCNALGRQPAYARDDLVPLAVAEASEGRLLLSGLDASLSYVAWLEAYDAQDTLVATACAGDVRLQARQRTTLSLSLIAIHPSN